MPAKRTPHPYAPCILVVDDETQVRRLFQRILEDAGYFVTVATSGRDALRAVEDRFFELAVVDMSMPDMDGFELLKAIRDHLPSIKVLMVSGFLHGSLLPLARHLGAVAVLQKPLDPDTLLLTVCDILTTA